MTALPEHIGPYRVLRLLGEGGMGRVYACHDAGLDREVAVKVLLPELARQGEMSARFLREARAMAKLASPFVVTVFQVGEHEGAPFLVMELLDGQDLSRALKDGPLPVAEAVRLVHQAALGLKVASEAGLVHRDVKPANLFVTRAGLKLTDFGLARPIDGSQDLTQAGLVVGSPHYLAPELARGAVADLRSDIYALGVTLFELLAGRPPYQGTTAVEVVSAHITQAPPPLASLRADVPAPLAAIVERTMAKEPAARFADYASLIAALEGVLSPHANAAIATPAPGAIRSSPGHTALLGTVPVPGAPASTLLGAGPSAAGPSDRGPSDSAPSDTVLLTPSSVAVPTPSPSLPTSKGATPAVHTSGPMPHVKTETLTVMFTDIAGYTERTGTQSREEAAHWLALHDALLLPVIKGFDGKVVKTIGDALLVTFRSPTDAVLCGTAIQDRLFLHNQSVAEADRIEVRVALSAGEVRVHKGDVFGEPVNVAARLEKLAKPGEVVLSDAVFSTMNAAEVRTASLGPQTLKGISRAVEVYRAVPDAGEGPPFGGRALERLERLGKLSPVVEVALDKGRAVATTVLQRIRATLRELWDTLGRLLGPRGRTVSAAVGALVLLGTLSIPLGLSPITWFGSDPEAEAHETAAPTPGPAGFFEGFQAPTDPEPEPERERKGDREKERAAIQQLAEGASCGLRRQALFTLKRVGRTPEALEALKTAGKRMPDNLCLALDLVGAEQAVERRLP